MSSAQIANDVRYMTGRYLADGGPAGTGIPGVVAFGPQLFRHIIATFLLKTKRMRLKAAALQLRDHPKTLIDHYASSMPDDVREELDAEWREMQEAERRKPLS